MKANTAILLLVIVLMLSFEAIAQRVFTDIKYAQANDRELFVDIYLPEGVENPYIAIWIHGGAWHSGTKENPPKGLLSASYALASEYGYRPDKIIMWGSSAGGHLVALVGTINGSEYIRGLQKYQLRCSSNYRFLRTNKFHDHT